MKNEKQNNCIRITVKTRGGWIHWGGAPTYNLTNFSRKLHKNEENWTERGLKTTKHNMECVF